MTPSPGIGLQALVLNQLQTGVIAHAPDGRVLFANERASSLLSRERESLTGRTAESLYQGWVRKDGRALPVQEHPILQVLATQQMVRDVLVGVDRPGHRGRAWLMVSAFPEFTAEGEIEQAVLTFVDVTARRTSEELQKHLLGVLRAFRRLNQLAGQEMDRDELVRRACAILTESGGYRSAWVGLREGAGLRLAGESGLGPAAEALARQLGSGWTPPCAERALRQSGVVLTREPHLNCDGCDLAHAYPGVAGITVALGHREHVYGVLAMSLPIARAGDAQELELFGEIASALGFSIHALEIMEARRRSTEALWRSEELLQEVGRIGRIGGWAVDLVNGTARWTQSVYDLLNIDPSEPPLNLQQGVLLCVEEDRPRAAEAIRALIENGTPMDFEARSDVPGRGIRWFRALGHAVREDGRCVALRGTVNDITERKQAEAAAVTSRARLDFALETSGAGGWDLDLITHRAYRTRQHARIFGYDSTADPWTLEKFFGHILPEDRPEVARRFAEATEAKSDLSFECRIRRVGGDVRWIRVAGGHQVDEAGIARRLAGIVQDVTEEKEAEAALRESEERFHRSFHGSPVAQTITAMDGVIVEANDAFIGLVGTPREQILGRTTVGLGLWVDPEQREGMVREARDKGAIRDQEVRVRVASGEVRNAIASFQTIDLGGQPHLISTVVDVTGRKRAEEELRESQRKYQALIETTGDFIWEMDAQGRYTYCSPQMKTLWGTEPASMIGRTPFDLMPPEARARALEQFVETTRAARPFLGMETVSYDGRGNVVQIETSGVPFFDEKGALLGYRGVSRDITERKRAEQARAESEERFRRSFQSNPAGQVVVRHPEGTILEINDAFLRMLGYSRDECVGRSLVELGAWDDLDQRETLLGDVLAGGTVRGREIVFRTRSRERCTLIASIESMELAGERLLLGTGVNITERKRAEQQRVESEERFRTLVDGAPDGVFVQSGGRVVFANPAMARLLGAGAADDLVGRDFLPWIAPEFHDTVRERIRRQAETGEPAPPLEHVYLRFDGSQVPVESVAVPLRYEGREAHLVFVRDISARRKAEREREALREQLEQAQKMESVGRLAGGVAHDFNNMLTVQKGYCELIKRGLGTEGPLAESLAQIEGAADRAAALTRQLLAFSRKQTLKPRVLDLNDLVCDMDRMLRRLIGEDVELVTTLAPEPAVIRADPGQLEQVIVNLVVNARDAMPSGGCLTIELSMVRLAEAEGGLPAGCYAELSVGDTGIGMDEDTRRRIFEPFFTTKEVGRGTGLGLSTVDGIVHQSGGTISVRSAPGEGTVFVIRLPAIEEAPAPGLAPERRAVPGRGESVLIVEDEATLRELLVRQVGHLGYSPAAAANGDEALALVEDGGLRPELVLTDVVMPGMSGRVLMDRLRVLLPEAEVIFMSGYTDDAIVQHGVLEEGIAFLPKPFVLDELAAHIRTALAGRRRDRRGAASTP